LKLTKNFNLLIILELKLLIPAKINWNIIEDHGEYSSYIASTGIFFSSEINVLAREQSSLVTPKTRLSHSAGE
jgi:hypothetical protein